MFLSITATEPHGSDGTVYFSTKVGPTFKEYKEQAAEYHSTQTRGFLMAAILGLRSMNADRTSEQRIPVMVSVENSNPAFVRELCNRSTAGPPDDRDHSLWVEYLQLRSRFELKFPVAGGEMLTSLN